MKKKSIILLVIVIAIIIIIACLRIFVFADIGGLKESTVSNIMANITNEETGADMIFIFSFDKKDICVGWKWYQKESTQEKLEQAYNSLMDSYNKTSTTKSVSLTSNIKLQDGFFTCDRNQWNGHKKSEVLEYINTEGWNIIEFE